MQGPKWPLFYSHIDPVWSLLIIGIGCTLGRAPRTKETLPDFREWCRVTRHPRVFRRLTSCQRTPRFWGVTAWYQSLGIRIPTELEFGYSSPLSVVRCRVRYVGT